MKKKTIVALTTTFVLFLISVFYWSSLEEPSNQEKQASMSTVWTCAMHPQIKMPSPGKCPICGMELILLKTNSDSREVTSLELSERARKLAEVTTTLVRKGEARLTVSMYGKLELDESRVAHITARTNGRIERLFLDFTGVSVRKGDHMVEVYSPDLITAQQELIQARHTLETIRDDASEFLKTSLKENLESAREKLLLWGLQDSQIDLIAHYDQPEKFITLNAPIGGVVIHKEANEGKYVKEGTKIYTIADLSELWLILDAYETDLIWLRHGQEISFKAEAIPGKTFKGLISFIDPVLNEKKRTVRVRANIKNLNGMLKPGMFIRAIANPLVGATGNVVSKSLEGKWIGPMHPQIVQDNPGSCPICKMDLVPAESLGYVSLESEEGQLPLLIPTSAPLITGKRAIVFVEEPDSIGSYEARSVILGPRAGDDYIVYEGLKEGERIVLNGNFKIDSASQILGKPSMMREGGINPIKRHSH